MPQIDWTGAGCAAICIAIKCIFSPGRVYRVEAVSGNPPAVTQVDHMAKLAGHQQPLHDLRMPRRLQQVALQTWQGLGHAAVLPMTLTFSAAI